MRKRLHESAAAPGWVRRRAHRRKIWEALHGICLKIEQLQRTEDARLACREVAQALKAARARETGPGKLEEL